MYSSTLQLQLQLITMKPTNASKDAQIQVVQRKETIFAGISNKGGDHPVDLHVQQLLQRQAKGSTRRKNTHFDRSLLTHAYERCRKICAQHATTFYFGTFILLSLSTRL